jgi:hypothetical protein
MDAIALLLSRLRFAFTISFRIPALTIGLAAWLTILEALHLTTGRAAYCVTFEFGSRYSVWHSASASSNQRSKHSHGTPTVAIHVSDLVPLPDHLGVVDPAPPNRHCASYWLDPARLVARRRGSGRRGVRGDACLYRIPDRGDAFVRLVGRVFLSLVQRYPPPRLGCRLRR